DHASYYPALLGRIAGLPGVRSAGFARSFPRLSGETLGQAIGFVGEPPAGVRPAMEVVSPGFFETVGVPLVAGRLPTWSDAGNTRAVAVVSESLAMALAPDGDILQRRVRFGATLNSQDLLIVGVVGNATQGNPRIPAPPVIYRPALQLGPIPMYPNLVVKTAGNDAAVGAGIRDILREGGREYAHEIATLDDVFARAPSSERMSATLAAAVGGLAMLIAVIGAHGTLAY